MKLPIERYRLEVDTVGPVVFRLRTGILYGTRLWFLFDAPINNVHACVDALIMAYPQFYFDEKIWKPMHKEQYVLRKRFKRSAGNIPIRGEFQFPYRLFSLGDI